MRKSKEADGRLKGLQHVRSCIARDTELRCKVLLNVTGVQCFPGCNAECLGKLTTGSREKAMFNGQVLEPLVLLVEVINIMPPS